MSRSQPLVILAPAKVNLTLEVLGRRPDGYHEIASIMQAISLADTLTLSVADALSFHCNIQELDNQDNLVLKAAHLLKQESGIDAGAEMQLQKVIPSASGLGGGSSDAAAALRGLNSLWGLGLGTEGLMPLASRLGADVPFFLRGGTALAEGRGERLTPIPSPREQWLVMVATPHTLSNKTARLYRALKPSDFSDGQRTRSLAESLRKTKHIDPHLPFNVFQALAPDLFAGLRDSLGALQSLGVGPAHLSGTGPTLYALVERRRGEEAVSKMADAGIACHLVRTVGPWEDLGPGPQSP